MTDIELELKKLKPRQALLDKAVFGNIGILGFDDIENLIKNNIVEMTSSKVKYITASGQVFNRLLIENDGVIDRMVAGSKLIQNKRVDYCNLETTIKNDKVGNLACYTLDDYVDRFEIFKKDPQNKESIKFAVISISVDDFHKNDVQKALDFYRKYANEYVLIDIQSEWKIEEDANGRIMNMEEYRKLKKEILSSNVNFTWIDNTGKAKDNNIGFQETEYSLEDDILTSQHCCNLCHRIEMKDDFIMCRMEITANGRLCLGKQSSYDYEDNYYIGDVLEQPISCMIVKWQWKEPLLCREIETLFKCESILKHSNNLSESDRFLLEKARDLLMLKRDALKRIHNMYPNFSYSEAVKGVNADLNIRTEGNFTRVLANFLPDYDKNYVYDEDREQAICDRLRYGNRYDIYNTLLKTFGGII